MPTHDDLELQFIENVLGPDTLHTQGHQPSTPCGYFHPFLLDEEAEAQIGCHFPNEHRYEVAGPENGTCLSTC